MAPTADTDDGDDAQPPASTLFGEIGVALLLAFAVLAAVGTTSAVGLRARAPLLAALLFAAALFGRDRTWSFRGPLLALLVAALVQTTGVWQFTMPAFGRVFRPAFLLVPVVACLAGAYPQRTTGAAAQFWRTALMLLAGGIALWATTTGVVLGRRELLDTSRQATAAIHVLTTLLLVAGLAHLAQRRAAGRRIALSAALAVFAAGLLGG